MIHVLIDTNIYRADRKRSKPAFRALARLAKAGKLQLHIPTYVKLEFLSQQHRDIKKEIKAISKAAKELLNITEEVNLTSHADSASQVFDNALVENAPQWIDDEFHAWMTGVKMIEHQVQPDHGQIVMEAYFAGKPPFGEAKNRSDFPDAFIWQTTLDLAKAYGSLSVITGDERFNAAAASHLEMEAYKTLDGFIDSDECQDALAELAPEIVVENMKRLQSLLSTAEAQLIVMLQARIVDSLAGKTVRHRSIPDDNHEGTITTVGDLEGIEFDFEGSEYYGDGEVSIPFTGTSECSLNYAIYKGDYHILDDEESEAISISERNDHYYDADQDFTIEVCGTLNLSIDVERLEDFDLSDKDLQELAINKAMFDIEIERATVQNSDMY